MTTTPASPVTLSKLVSRQGVAERAITFRFEKPPKKSSRIPTLTRKLWPGDAPATEDVVVS